MKHFVCKRLRMCGYLADRGFTPVRVVPDEQNPKYNVFLFEETPELTAAVLQYLSVDCKTARVKNEQKEGRKNEYFQQEK